MFDTQLLQGESTHLLQSIDDEIERLLDERKTLASRFGEQFLELWNLATHCAKGGKLLRPRLLIGFFDSATLENQSTGSTRQTALQIAAAIELLHFSFLLHDDVIDEDLQRRGEPNLIGRLIAQTPFDTGDHNDALTTEHQHVHWARSNAILIGDLMLSIAHQTFARAKLNDAQRQRLLELLDHAVMETVIGEHLDVTFADAMSTPDLHAVLDMTRLKTATYTFELPLRAAAILTGASLETEHALGVIARHLGVAFQLQDDLLSAFSERQNHGKDDFSDFREAKETALVAVARTTTDWPRIQPLIGSDDFTKETAEQIQSLLTECGARSHIETMVQHQLHEATSSLESSNDLLPETSSHFLRNLVDSLDGRRA